MRLKGHDDSQAGYDFVSICTLHRRETLGRIVGGDAHIAPSVLLSEIGAITEKYINNKIQSIRTLTLINMSSCWVTSI